MWCDFLFICVLWRDLSFQYTWCELYFAWHDSFILCDMTTQYCVTWLTVWDKCTPQLIHVTWLIHIVWHDSFMLCDMTHSHCVTWLIHIVWHDSSALCNTTHSFGRDATPGRILVLAYTQRNPHTHTHTHSHDLWFLHQVRLCVCDFFFLTHAHVKWAPFYVFVYVCVCRLWVCGRGCVGGWVLGVWLRVCTCACHIRTLQKGPICYQ